MAFPLIMSFLFSALTVPWNLPWAESHWNHVDHVVKVNEGVIDGNDVHFARIKSSPGDQVPDAAESIHSDLHHLVSGMRLAQHRSYGSLSNGQEQRAIYHISFNRSYFL